MSRVLNGIMIGICCFFAVVVAYPLLSGHPLDLPEQQPASKAAGGGATKAGKAPPAAAINGSQQLTSPPTGVGYAGDPCPEGEREDEEGCREAKPAPACKGKRKQCERERGRDDDR
jgi:hypothetical protein